MWLTRVVDDVPTQEVEGAPDQREERVRGLKVEGVRAPSLALAQGHGLSQGTARVHDDGRRKKVIRRKDIIRSNIFMKVMKIRCEELV
jgi:hypothetical protein